MSAEALIAARFHAARKSDSRTIDLRFMLG